MAMKHGLQVFIDVELQRLQRAPIRCPDSYLWFRNGVAGSRSQDAPVCVHLVEDFFIPTWMNPRMTGAIGSRISSVGSLR